MPQNNNFFLLLFMVPYFQGINHNNHSSRSSFTIIDSKQMHEMKEKLALKDYQANSMHADSILFDTISLTQFWDNFQKNIRANNKDAIFEDIELPVYGFFPVVFQYSYDCDTIAYTRNLKKYENLQIDKHNIDLYFNFLFNDTLKKMILETPIYKIYHEGFYTKYSGGIGIDYLFFAKNYGIKVKCPNDHNLSFYFKCESSKWKISIGGL